MKFEYMGLLIDPDEIPWSKSHAALPIVYKFSDDTFRVIFASRNDENHSAVGYAEFDIQDPIGSITFSSSPVIEPGRVGGFDWQGVLPSSIVQKNGVMNLYTSAWNRGFPDPMWYSSIGLAQSYDQGSSFEKYGNSPIMTRSDCDPCLVASPMVLYEDGTWHCWYVSCSQWVSHQSGLQSYYNIKYAHSSDGINWIRSGETVIDFIDGETNIARMSVIKLDDIYHGWFCSSSRNKPYSIKKAVSPDGKKWYRDEQFSYLGSGLAWDDEMQSYPWVIKDNDNLYMFYCGNAFGKTGIGLARATID